MPQQGFIRTAAAFIAALTISVFFIDFPVSAAEKTKELSLSAASAVMINAKTGTVLYAKNENEQRAIASTTKIMTALLTIEAGNLDEKFTVDSAAIHVEGTSMGLLEGDIVTRRALCCGMLLPSGNDAANAAAINVAGTFSAFAEKMNKKAEQLGMKNTHFVNPSGLDAENHYSTARDMAVLTRYALQNETFRSICCMSSAKVEFGNPPYKRRLANSNKMLWNYEGCTGVKTGFTEKARRCLVTSAERDGTSLIAVTLNAPNDWNDHKIMLDYGFSIVSPHAIEISPAEISVPVVGGTVTETAVVPADTVSISLTDSEFSRVTTEIQIEPFLYAGFEKGAEAGKAVFYLDGVKIGEENLVTVTAAGRDGRELNFFEGLSQYFAQLFDQ